MAGIRQAAAGHGESRPGRLLPDWSAVLVVIAHPDDETFGLGAVIDGLTSSGAAAHVLCYTHGEASTLNETGTDLYRAREAELEQASAELGSSTVTLLDYPDGQLSGIPPAELAAHVTRLAARHHIDGVLVFDDTGITGHPDHQAATRAAVLAAITAGLPVLAWTLPAAIAGRLRDETGRYFAGRPPHEVDLCVRVNRARQRKAALLHVTQVSPTAVLWRRLQLQGECEHLRWLLPPKARARRPQP
ncbi:MAG TPA: PIG-L deacetylase family protein [Streptosporangiaceae bacterium]|nr:PIG-L deacetylase family protein [Streptosporangiaceae bacterium]